MKIKVKHLIEYLQSLNPEMQVILDKDGWMSEDINPINERDLIEGRGIFYIVTYKDNSVLVINN